MVALVMFLALAFINTVLGATSCSDPTATTGVNIINGVQTYCDTSTSGGGWTLVAAQAGSGIFISGDINFDPTHTFGTPAFVGNDWDHTTYWYQPYNTIPHDEVMFMSGDRSKWCILSYDSITTPFTDPGGLNAPVHNSFGTPVKCGAFTNVLYRPGANPEDPWVGCEGDHFQNIATGMLWGEADYDALPGHKVFKDTHQGIGYFVRASQTWPYPTTVSLSPVSQVVIGNSYTFSAVTTGQSFDGNTITFTLNGQSCSGVISNNAVTCSTPVTPFNLATDSVGPYNLVATWVGDSCHLMSSDSVSVDVVCPGGLSPDLEGVCSIACNVAQCLSYGPSGCTCAACAPGFILTAGACQPCPVPGCTTFSSGCTCSICGEGYTIFNGACVPNCDFNNGGCDLDAICCQLTLTTTPECACNVGFQGNGLVCTDIDECGALHPCNAGWVCLNVPGTFGCLPPQPSIRHAHGANGEGEGEAAHGQRKEHYKVYWPQLGDSPRLTSLYVRVTQDGVVVQNVRVKHPEASSHVKLEGLAPGEYSIVLVANTRAGDTIEGAPLIFTVV